MRRLSLLLVSFVLAVSLGASALLPKADTPGSLIVVGGGGTPDEVIALALEMAGGREAKVAVLPYASGRENRGIPSAEMWREAGAAEAWNLDDPEQGDPAERLREADLIWMPGGSQSRLIEELEERGLLELVRERHAEGVIVGGTSAGAAVMSSRMLAGPPDEEGLLKDRADIGRGLGLWPGVVVDQHFVQRDRYGRLISAVMDAPQFVGIGISERTAAVVTFKRQIGSSTDNRLVTEFEVVGESHVIVIDARSARIEVAEPGSPHGARGMKLEVLRPGMKGSIAPSGGSEK